MRQLVCLDPPCLGCVACRSGALPLSEDLQDEVGFRMLRAVEPRWTGRGDKGDNLHRDRVILAYSRTLKRLNSLLWHLKLQIEASYGKSHAITRNMKAANPLGKLRSMGESMLDIYVEDIKELPCCITQIFFGSLKCDDGIPRRVEFFDRPLPKQLPIESQQLLREANYLAAALPRRTRVFVQELAQGNPNQETARDYLSQAEKLSGMLLTRLVF
jgi:hypothetical protein